MFIICKITSFLYYLLITSDLSTFNYSLCLVMQKINKIFFWILGALVGLTLLTIFVGWPILKSQTKKNSPEQIVTYTQEDIVVRPNDP